MFSRSLGVEVLRRGAGKGALLQFVPLHESEESGEVPGLSALFSTCTSTEAYSVVSVRDFLCLFRIRVWIAIYHLCLILVDVYDSD